MRRRWTEQRRDELLIHVTLVQMFRGLMQEHTQACAERGVVHDHPDGNRVFCPVCGDHVIARLEQSARDTLGLPSPRLVDHMHDGPDGQREWVR